MSLQLPDVIVTYFDISNGGDVSKLASCFCTNATVFDENKTHVGIKAIEAWQHEARRAFSYQVNPLQALRAAGSLTVIAQVTGNFPGSPVRLAHAFTFEAEQIRSLEITPC